MIYNKDILNWTPEELSKLLHKEGLSKMSDDINTSQLVVPEFIFTRLIENDILSSFLRKRGFKDLIGKAFFKPCEDGKGRIYTRNIIRIWNEDRLVEYMQSGRRICL